MFLVLTFLCSSIIGCLIGWSGIAGFLLPIFLTGYLKIDSTTALCISFVCFLISGSLGSFTYFKNGYIDLKSSVPLLIGSFIGAIIGVYLNSLIETNIVVIILYVVVLVSGISILIRIFTQKNKRESKIEVKLNSVILLIFGFLSSIICALSGAGGPILVMPILVLLGLSTRKAVALALFDSVFIAIPSSIGYWILSDIESYLIILIVAGVSHAIGVLIGSNTAYKVNQYIIKLSVGIFSVIIALWKILQFIV